MKTAQKSLHIIRKTYPLTAEQFVAFSSMGCPEQRRAFIMLTFPKAKREHINCILATYESQWALDQERMWRK